MTDKPQHPNSTPSSPKSGSTTGQAGRREPDFDLNALDDTPVGPRERRERERRQGAPVRSGRGGGGGLAVSLIAMILLVAVAAVGFMELSALKRKMASAQKSLDSMNMLTENQYDSLQSALDSADKQRSKWIKEVDDKLSFLDGEMRKLWVIAHQTNQPQIKKLESDLAELSKATKEAKEQVAVNKKQLKTHDQTLAKLKVDEAQIKQGLATLNTLKAQLAEQKIRLDDVPVAMEALKLQILELENKSKEAAVLLKQLDQYRGQVNRSIDQLTEEIRLLKGGASQPGL